MKTHVVLGAPDPEMEAMYDSIYHVTLDTGNVYVSPRKEVDEIYLPALLRRIKKAAAGRGSVAEEIPGQPNYLFTATERNGCLLATIWWNDSRTLRLPVITFGVACEQSVIAAGLWGLLHGERSGIKNSYATDPSMVPNVPWVAARMEIGSILIDQNDLLWMADFERCIAWAWTLRRQIQ